MAKAAQETRRVADKQSIRAEVELLREANELVDLNAPVDREFELSAIL
jgi:3-polyprenyl-4-hydroxybenzoate decarboxylase